MSGILLVLGFLIKHPNAAGEMEAEFHSKCYYKSMKLFKIKVEVTQSNGECTYERLGMIGKRE